MGGWKDKNSGAECEPEKEDVKKLVVKFRTIIKVAHHNLDQLEKNLVEGCLSAYPEITEDMLEAKTIPLQQNGEIKKESSDNETKNADKKVKSKKEKKESKREKNKGDDEGDSDGGSDGQAKKAKKKNLDILAMKFDESDSSE